MRFNLHCKDKNLKMSLSIFRNIKHYRNYVVHIKKKPVFFPVTRLILDKSTTFVSSIWILCNRPCMRTIRYRKKAGFIEQRIIIAHLRASCISYYKLGFVMHRLTSAVNHVFKNDIVLLYLVSFCRLRAKL